MKNEERRMKNHIRRNYSVHHAGPSERNLNYMFAIQEHPSFTTNKNLQKSNKNDDSVQIPVQFFVRFLKIFEDFCLHAMGC